MAASSLLVPGITDGEVTHTKRQLPKWQQAQYYNRGTGDLDQLEGDPVGEETVAERVCEQTTRQD